MRQILLLVILGLMINSASAQSDSPTLSLHQCYEKIYQHYPVADKVEIQKKITELNSLIARSGTYPELQISAGSSYQSDVTEIPFAAPGSNVPVFSKDHYNVSAALTQSLFDGGRSRLTHQLQGEVGAVELAKIESELWTIRQQVDQIYFGILKMQKQNESMELMLKDIEEQLEMVQAMVRNGLVLPGNELVLKAEHIKAVQQVIEIEASIRAGYQMLGEILGEPVETDTILEVPNPVEINLSVNEEVDRAEFDIFEATERQLNTQKELSAADRWPTVSAFAQSAYGRPGLNAFEDELQFYWKIGLTARWSLKNWKTASRNMEIAESRKRVMNADREAFTRQLYAQLRQKEEQITALDLQLKQDQELHQLHRQIVEEKRKLLEEGVIHSTEYVTELNAENRVRINLEMRQITRLQLITELATQKGIVWN